MKPALLLCAALFFSISLKAQTTSAGFDKRLADSLGADENGMKMYTLVMLKRGGDTSLPKAKRDRLFAGHMQNIGRLAQEGKLIVAGPLGKNDGGYAGIFILAAKTVKEATALLQTDPAVKAGQLVPEVYRWYGSAALPMYLPYHERTVRK